MILLCGIADEPPIAMLRHQLEQMASPFLMLDQRDFKHTHVDFCVSDRRITGRIEVFGPVYDLATFRSVYTRLMESAGLPSRDSREGDGLGHRHWQSVCDALVAWLAIAPALVVNRSAPMMSNFSKPYQQQLIQAQGFFVPETLITNDPDVVYKF
jgi:hypothetical protein